MSTGVIYVATTSNYVELAYESAGKLKSHMPEIPICLFTSEDYSPKVPNIDAIEEIKNPNYDTEDKIEPMINSPFYKTLFLDADTEIAGDLSEVFDLLDVFEFAYAHAPVRIEDWDLSSNIPECFPQPNTGVIAYKKTDKVVSLLKRWKSRDEEYKTMRSGKKPHEQPALRKELYRSDIRSTILPPEYNIRTPFPMFKGGNSYVKILHGAKKYRKDISHRMINDFHSIVTN